MELLSISCLDLQNNISVHVHIDYPLSLQGNTNHNYLLKDQITYHYSIKNSHVALTEWNLSSLQGLLQPFSSWLSPVPSNSLPCNQYQSHITSFFLYTAVLKAKMPSPLLSSIQTLQILQKPVQCYLFRKTIPNHNIRYAICLLILSKRFFWKPYYVTDTDKDFYNALFKLESWQLPWCIKNKCDFIASSFCAFPEDKNYIFWSSALIFLV